MNRRKLVGLILYLFIFICCFGIGYSLYNISKWAIDSKKTQNQIEDVQNIVEMEMINDDDGNTVVNLDLDSPYYKYAFVDILSVNFNKLLEVNNQIEGWIKVNGTDINYPYVQTSNNEFYLYHSLDKTRNDAGWIFLDYRNNPNLDNKNTVLYAHGRQDGTMFGSLKKVLNTEWQSNIDNYIVNISTPYADTVWQVFSIYVIPTTSDYIQTTFSSDEEFITWVNVLKNRSSFNFNVNLTAQDKIVTLSTCYTSEEKLVLHARLIKYNAK